MFSDDLKLCLSVALNADVNRSIKVILNVALLSFTGSRRQQSVLLEESLLLH